MAWPSSTSRESTTRQSECLQNGQRTRPPSSPVGDPAGSDPPPRAARPRTPLVGERRPCNHNIWGQRNPGALSAHLPFSDRDRTHPLRPAGRATSASERRRHLFEHRGHPGERRPADRGSRIAGPHLSCGGGDVGHQSQQDDHRRRDHGRADRLGDPPPTTDVRGEHRDRPPKPPPGGPAGASGHQASGPWRPHRRHDHPRTDRPRTARAVSPRNRPRLPGVAHGGVHRRRAHRRWAAFPNLSGPMTHLTSPLLSDLAFEGNACSSRSMGDVYHRAPTESRKQGVSFEHAFGEERIRDYRRAVRHAHTTTRHTTTA